jgi:UDP-4-amino-4,6-dideoxy-N-acetyl-beta-L-altrosamine transaminase
MDCDKPRADWLDLMIPYGRQEISDDDVAAVVGVLRSDWLTQGPIVPRFEQALADYCGIEHAIAVNSATSALHIACLALEVGPGDLVWTSPITFVASANCARYCGADVDFVDIDRRTYNLSVEKLAEKLVLARRNGRIPRVVIPVHLCGQSCDMEAIHALSLEFGFRIIEDASHAIGAEYCGEHVGCGRYSDITVLSFHPVKIITSGEGGAALTSDEVLAQKMRQYRSHGVTTDLGQMAPRSIEEIWNYQQVALGYNYRLTDIHAALGLSQMARIDEFVSRRREIAKRYDELFDELPIVCPWQHPKTQSSYHLYPIRVPSKDGGVAQREIYDALRAAGIGVNLHYIPVYLQPYYEALGFSLGYCPEAERYFRETLSIPIFPGLTAEDQDHIVSSIRNALCRLHDAFK